MTPRNQTPYLSRSLGLILLGGLIWYAINHSPAPLFGFLGMGSALVSLRIGEQSVERYGRRIPVTEMIGLGRQGDRALLIGGCSGYLMLLFFGLAAYSAL